jgi:PadR family transcriptional regulator, regulatory protein AphA
MTPTAVTPVVLGLLSHAPRTGYDIKAIVDRSTRFFWAASYGQIYPELKRLEKAGLITGDDSSQGARQRTTFKLTAEGRRAAREWIGAPPEVLETRDEGLLMLFFAGSIEPARGAEIARERAATSRAKASELRAIADHIDATGTPEGAEAKPDAGSMAVLRYGIEMSEWAAEWFERAAEDLENQTADREVGATRG